MAKEQMTPMMTQYLKTKEEYEDCILSVSYTHLTLPTIA